MTTYVSSTRNLQNSQEWIGAVRAGKTPELEAIIKLEKDIKEGRKTFERNAAEAPKQEKEKEKRKRRSRSKKQE